MSAEETPQRVPVEERPRTLARLPAIASQILAWIAWLIRPALALLGLMLVLIILQAIRQIPVQRLDPGSGRPASEPSSFTLRPFTEQPDLEHRTIAYQLTGQTEPYAYLEITVAGRQLEILRANREGVVDQALDLPIQAHQAAIKKWAGRPGEPGAQQIGTAGTVFEWAGPVIYKPYVDLAYYNPEEQMLWVAIQTMPHDLVVWRLETETGVYSETARADPNGVIDRFVTLESAPSSPVEARLDNEDAPAAEPRPVTTLSLAQFPLVRQSELTLSADRSALAAAITLPREHPYMRALVQGLVGPEAFYESTAGGFYPTGGLVLTPTLSSRGDQVQVHLEGSWSTPLARFSFGPSGEGLASWPLLTERDQITVRREGVALAWLDEPLPTEMAGELAAWRGPMAAEKNRPLVSVGVELPEKAQEETGAQAQAAERVERESLQSFIGSLEGSTPLARVWSTLILLIPYGAIIWVVQRQGRDRPAAARWITAAVMVLALWRNRSNFYALVLSGLPHGFIEFFSAPVSSALGLETYSTLGAYGQIYRYHPSFDFYVNAFWLLFVALVGLVPLYFPLLLARLQQGWKPALSSPNPAPLPRGRRVLEGLATAGRILLALLGLALFWLPRHFYPRLGEAASIIQKLLSQTHLHHELVETLDRVLSALTGGLEAGMNNSFFPLFLIGSLVLLALAVNWRAALAALGLLLASSYARLPTLSGIESGLLSRLPQDIWLLQRFIWIWVLAAAGLMICPLLGWLLRFVTPRAPEGVPEPRWRHGRLALGLGAVALTLPDLPAGLLLNAAGTLLFLALGWLLLEGMGTLWPDTRWADWYGRWRWGVRLGLLLLGLALSYPMVQAEGDTLELFDLYRFHGTLISIFTYVLIAVLIFWLWLEARGRRAARYLPSLEAGVLLFAVFCINSPVRWFFVPVPLLVGYLMARFWLFRPVDEAFQQALEQSAGQRKKLLQEILDAQSAERQLNSYRKALTAQIESGKLSIEEMEAQLAAYKETVKEKLALAQVQGIPSRSLVFALGESGLWQNSLTALKFGALLACIPLLITLYQELPTRSAQYPFPIIDVPVFLLKAVSNWLLYAFFFGHFYVRLRGNSGLVKGVVLCIGMVTPFAALELLNLRSLEQMQNLILWVIQVFFFCTFLGLAMDYKLLLSHGLGLKDLPSVHNVSVLSIYSTWVVAAVIPPVQALLNDQLGRMATFFVTTVLGIRGGE